MLLAACAVPPAPRSVTPPAASAGQWLSRSLDDPGLRQWLRVRGAERTPGAPWTLRQLRLAALYFHPGQQLARAGVQLARADLRIAGQWPNPRLQLDLKYQATQAAALPSPWTLGAAVALLLWSHEQRQAQQQRAEAALRAARAMLDASAWDLRQRVDAAFIDAWQSRRELTLREQALGIARRRMQILDERERQGWVSPWRIDTEQRLLRRQQRAVLDARARVARSRIELAAALGVPARALRGQALELRQLDAPGADDFRLPSARLAQQALRRRADVLAAWQRVRAARAEVRRQISLRDGAPPRVAPGYQRDQGVDDVTLRADLPLPLWNQHQGEIDAARARQAQAQARLLEVQARAASRIEQARAALRAADSARQLAQAAWRRARRAWQGAEAPDTHDWLDPLQRGLVRRRWVLAQLDLLGARARQWHALAELRAALQTGGLQAVGGPARAPVHSPDPDARS